MSESEHEGELDVRESIIQTRKRRRNAGNRMKTLLVVQEPEETDENEIFREVEGDDEFDLETFKQHRKRQKKEREENGEEPDDVNVGDDEFSEDSELSEDDQDLDEGERNLIKQQRTQLRERRKKERAKMFKIKAPPKEAKPSPKAPKKERSTQDTITSLMADTRRSSQRRSAIRNRERVIERLLENERRRSEYVAPTVRKKKKLTQAQRLAEAKITEQKNTASLHNFIEIEEQRKHAQRMALLGKRPRLVNFVRTVSRTVYEYPEPNLVEPLLKSSYSSYSGYTYAPSGQGQLYAGLDTVPKLQDSSSGQLFQGLDSKAGVEGQKEPQLSGTKDVTPNGKKEELGTQTSNAVPDSEDRDAESEDSASKMDVTDRKGSTPDSGSASEASPETDETSSNPGPQDKAEAEDAKHETDRNGSEINSTAEDKPLGINGVSKEGAVVNGAHAEASSDGGAADKPTGPEAPEVNEKDVSGTSKEVKLEIIKTDGDRDVTEDLPFDRTCAGPPAIKSLTSLTLEEFTEPINNKNTVRGIVFGQQTVKGPNFPPRRLCPITGAIAKYLDPKTGVAYLNIKTYKLLKQIANQEMSWSSSLGGAYTHMRGHYRHAAGVPPGFADPSELPQVKEKKTADIEAGDSINPKDAEANGEAQKEPSKEVTKETLEPAADKTPTTTASDPVEVKTESVST